MSIILKPMIPPAQAFIVNIAACVAVARAIEGLYGLDVKVKWPNDLMVGERKVSGILTEIGAEYGQAGVRRRRHRDQRQPRPRRPFPKGGRLRRYRRSLAGRFSGRSSFGGSWRSWRPPRRR